MVARLAGLIYLARAGIGYEDFEIKVSKLITALRSYFESPVYGFIQASILSYERHIFASVSFPPCVPCDLQHMI